MRLHERTRCGRFRFVCARAQCSCQPHQRVAPRTRQSRPGPPLVPPSSCSPPNTCRAIALCRTCLRDRFAACARRRVARMAARRPRAWADVERAPMAVVAAAALALALALAWPRGLRAEATMGRHAGGAVSKAWSNAVARGGSSTANGYNATALFSSPEGAAPPTLWSRWLAGLSDRPDRPLAASLVADLAYCPPDHAMRRARSLVGDTQRLHAFMRKLRDGRCVRVLNIGACASVHHTRVGLPRVREAVFARASS